MTGEKDLDERGKAYALVWGDAVRDTFESELFGELIPGLIEEAGGGQMLDLGCADGLAARLAGDGLERYVGVDLCPRPASFDEGTFVSHDLREGLGPVGPEPFDLYLASFGVASHFSAEELHRLVSAIVAHARSGSVVALEALGLHSLEWPRLWSTSPGSQRRIMYRLGRDVEVHPWAPGELFEMFERAGIEPVRAVDRSIQVGPKAGEDRYWPGLPLVREGINRLLAGDGSGRDPLLAPLPPLPAHPASAFHHEIASRRRELVVEANGLDPRELARAVWELEPRSGGGFGHGLLAVGRVR